MLRLERDTRVWSKVYMTTKAGQQLSLCLFLAGCCYCCRYQLVVMPYAALLSRETRAAMGVRLEGAVVVVDEAHNIVEAINQVHSKKLVLSEVR